MNIMTDVETDIASDVTIQVVANVGTFLSMRDEWNTLLCQTRQETAFLTWDWLFTWWEFFADADHTLQILLIRHEGKLVGIAPLQIQKCGIRKVRLLRFIGIGEPIADQVVSEYLDVFALPKWEVKTIESVAEWILANQSWVHLECDDVKEGFLIWDIVHKLQEECLVELIPKRRAFSVPLRQGEAYLDRLSASRQKRIARSQRALNAAGGLQRQSITTVDDLQPALNGLVKLHKQRWSSKNSSGVFESRRFTSFHRRVLELLWPQGKAGIETFSVDGKVVAALYCLYTDSTSYYYQSGFSGENSNKFMPLANAHIMEIERNQNQGRKFYDFMRGGSNSYKSEYGCEEVQLYTLHVFRRSLEHRYYLYRTTVGALLSNWLDKLGLRSRRHQ